MKLTGVDLAYAFVSEQLAGGVSCGIEGSIHGPRELFEKKSSNGFDLLLLDAKIAITSINRSSALLNASTLWSRASNFLYNNYQENLKLVLINTDVFISSEEGTTQDHPLSMLFYGVALLPLIKKLHNQTTHKQGFYADDAGACANFDDLKQWLQQVVDEGPKYGYYPDPQKSFLIVHPDQIYEAKRCFEQTGLEIVTGKRYVEGFIGDETTLKAFVHEKIKNWQAKMQLLSTAANFCPQESFSVFTKSVQSEWKFLMGVDPGCDEFLKPLGN